MDPTFMFPLYFLTLSTYSQLRPSRSIGRYFSKAILPRELYWSQLRSCNPHLIHLVSPPSEIHLVLGFSNSLNLFN